MFDLSAGAHLLEGLDPDQQAAVVAPLGPLRILAGAGTGKTRTLVHRIAYHVHTGLVPAERTLAVTHSTKAAGELAERLDAVGAGAVPARTFHGAALRQLRYFWEATGRPGTAPQVLGDPRPAVRSALAGVDRSRLGRGASALVHLVSTEIAWAHAQLVAPAEYAAAAAATGRCRDLDVELVAAAYARYEHEKSERGVLDFDDLLSACAQLLASRPDVAALVRNGYRSLVVDEYQDTDPAQQQLLDLWLGSSAALCVVGDPNQAIFGFKGADPRLLDQFEGRYPDARTVALTRNYRSTPQVVEAANAVARDACGPGTAPLTLTGMRPPGRRAEGGVFVDEAAEAAAIARHVKSLMDRGTPPGEIAVLHRFNAQAEPLREALAACDVPVESGAVTGYFEVSEVRRPLAWFAEAVAQEPQVAAETLMSECLDRAGFDADAAPAGGAALVRWENQRALLAMVRELVARRFTGPQVSAELARRADREASCTARVGVSVLTVHQAKGLEWDAVVVARAVEGSFPAARDGEEGGLLEEQRLFYVALTRARTDLFVTRARRRRAGWELRPSRYLEALEATSA